MSELQVKLRTFFGLDSLPILAESTELVKHHMQDLQIARDSSHSPSNLKHSPNSLPLPPKKHRRKQPNHISVTSEATISTKGTRLMFSTTNVSNVSQGEWHANMAAGQRGRG